MYSHVTHDRALRPCSVLPDGFLSIGLVCCCCSCDVVEGDGEFLWKVDVNGTSAWSEGFGNMALDLS